MHTFGALIMLPSNSFGINTCKSVSKQRTLSPSRINIYAKTGGGGPLRKGSPRAAQESKFWMSPLSRPTIYYQCVRTIMPSREQFQIDGRVEDAQILPRKHPPKSCS